MARRRLSTDPFRVSIDGLNADGMGVAEYEGRPLAVRDALPGETVQARYLLGRRFRGQAETLAVEHASADRAPAQCPSYGTCGACALQHMSGEAQLAFKQRLLLDSLAREGQAPDRVLPPLAGAPWSYRRKARLSVREVRAKERVLVGFRERDGRFVTDMSECHVLYAPVARHLGALAELLQALDGRAGIPQVEVCCGDEACALVFRHLEPLSERDLERLAGFSSATGLQVHLQHGGVETVRPLRNDYAPLSYRLPEFGLEFVFGPLDFVQVNGPLNHLMVRQALELLDLRPGHRVLDLFCGLGNFSLPTALEAGEVVGLEGAPELVGRAVANATRNGIPNVRFEVADLQAAGGPEAWPPGAWDRVLLDPPRSGARAVLPRVAGCGAGRVVYVSCNPVTLASDVALMVGSLGYRLAAAGIMDMFPQTPHVESMAVLERA